MGFFFSVLGIVCLPLVELIHESDIVKNLPLFEKFPFLGWIFNAIPGLFFIIAVWVIIREAFNEAKIGRAHV